MPMAKQKPTISPDNLGLREKAIHYSCIGIIGFFIGNLVLMIDPGFREYLCADFPNLYFLGLHALFISASVRLNEAYTHGSIPPDMEIGSKELVHQSENLLDPRPNYSVRSYNTIYFITVFISTGMMLFHLSLTMFME